MEGKEGNLNKQLNFRSWHSGRQGRGSLNKELDFGLWHSGWQGNGSLNKEVNFRSWHWRQGGGKVWIKNSILEFRAWHWGRYFFFRPTPDGSCQVVYQAGKTIAVCKFTELMQWQSWRGRWRRGRKWVGWGRLLEAQVMGFLLELLKVLLKPPWSPPLKPPWSSLEAPLKPFSVQRLHGFWPGHLPHCMTLHEQ